MIAIGAALTFLKGPAWIFLRTNWKVILPCVAIGVILLLWGRDRARVWESGVDYGDQRTQDRMEEAYKKQWAVALKGLEEDKKKYEQGIKDYETNSRVLNARGKELDAARTALYRLADKIGDTAKAQIEAGYEASAELDDAAVTAAIRKLSAELAADKSWRDTSIPAPDPK